jgi:hypothetical protein
VIDGRGQAAGPVAPCVPYGDQALVARVHHSGGMVGVVAQDMGRRVQPTVGFAGSVRNFVLGGAG